MTQLFKGAAVLRHSGEAISVLAELKDRTVLLYFAAGHADPCKPFNLMLSKFYDMVRETDDSIVVIFISNDKTKEEQVAFFNTSGMHPDWFMVEWTHDIEDIMDAFKVEKIPSLIVVSREGKPAVADARDQLFDLLLGPDSGKKGKAQGQSIEEVKANVKAKWQEWRRLAGDWRASEGHTLGGSSSSASSFVSPPGAQNDREALRAARLAALERRGLGGAGGPGAVGAGFVSSASSSTAPVAVVPLHVVSGKASGSSGSGTFAAGASPSPGVAYTLAGGRIELPSGPKGEDMELASDMASNGDAESQDAEVDEREAIASIVAMGFPEDSAQRALEASRGNVEEAIAHLLGDV